MTLGRSPAQSIVAWAVRARWSALAGEIGDLQAGGSQMQPGGQAGHRSFGAVGLDFSVAQRAVKHVSHIVRTAFRENPAVHVDDSGQPAVLHPRALHRGQGIFEIIVDRDVPPGDGQVRTAWLGG